MTLKFKYTWNRRSFIASLGAAFASLAGSKQALGSNAGGEAAHLGGGILGFAIMKNQHWLHYFEPRPRRRRTQVAASVAAPKRRRQRAFQKDWSKDFNR